MNSLEAELERARDLSIDELADAIQSIGFECTRCGGCCTAEQEDPHTATVFPDEIRELTDATENDWRDVARPMPYGLEERDQELEGETFEWALQTTDCGDCTFYEEDEDGIGACTVHENRPLICATYPFSIKSLSNDSNGGMGTTEPIGGVVDHEGMVRAHECEGLGRDISREDAEELAAALKERAIRELEEAIGVRDNYEPMDVDGVVVHDSEGQKRPDGTLLEDWE
jgi:Fe-S-cluster containining protein